MGGGFPEGHVEMDPNRQAAYTRLKEKAIRAGLIPEGESLRGIVHEFQKKRLVSAEEEGGPLMRNMQEQAAPTLFQGFVDYYHSHLKHTELFLLNLGILILEH